MSGTSRQEGSSGIAQIIQIAAPKQIVLAVRGEVVIDTRNEHVVVELGGCAENVSGVIQAVSRRKIVGRCLTRAESPVEITSVIGKVEHRRINPDALGIEVLQVTGRESLGCDALRIVGVLEIL